MINHRDDDFLKFTQLVSQDISLYLKNSEMQGIV